MPRRHARRHRLPKTLSAMKSIASLFSASSSTNLAARAFAESRAASATSLHDLESRSASRSPARASVIPSSPAFFSAVFSPAACACLIAASVLAGPAAATENPESAAAAPSPVHQKTSTPKFVRRSDDASLLRFGISASHASRIAFAGGERIESAVWDQQDLDLKTDSSSGQIFVRPKREGEIMIYVTTESGETAAIVLEAGLEKSPQNILLERTAPKDAVPMSGDDSRPASMLAPSPAPDFIAAVKRLARLAALEKEAPDVMKRSSCPRPSASLANALEKLAPLHPSVETCWTSRDLTAVVLRLRNPSAVPMRIREAALTGPTVAAIASEKTTLRLGESARLIYMEVIGND